MTRGVENIWISFENISSSETSSNSMIFMREDKMTSSKHMKYELGVSKKLKLKIHLKLLFFNLGYLSFIQIIFLQKIKYMENRVKWFPKVENGEKWVWNHFGIFLECFLLDFNRPVALFDLSDFVWILFGILKMSML